MNKHSKRSHITNLEELEQELKKFSQKHTASLSLLNEFLILTDSNLFDSAWYQQNYNLNSNADLVLHYLLYGAEQGYNPSQHFDTKFYLQKYPDVLARGINPLVHYLRQGALEGRYPKPPSRQHVWGLYFRDIISRPSLYFKKILQLLTRLKRGNLRGQLLSNVTNRHIYKEVAHVNYEQWVKDYDSLTDDDRKNISNHIKTFAQKPYISIVIFMTSRSQKWLEHSINSVIKQIYPYWELYLVYYTKRANIQPLKGNNHRVKAVFASNFQAAFNKTLATIEGSHIIFLGLGDELAEHALHMVAHEINGNPEAKFIYSDEDTLNKKGKRTNAHFKPDWNPDLFLSYPLTNNLGVYRIKDLKDLARENLGSAWHYYLSLRLTTNISTKQIRHIPYILYHRRNINQQSDLTLNNQQILQECLNDLGLSAKVELIPNHGFRLHYELPESAPLVSIIVYVEQTDVLARCIKSIITTSYSNYEIIIILPNEVTNEKALIILQKSFFLNEDNALEVLYCSKSPYEEGLKLRNFSGVRMVGHNGHSVSAKNLAVKEAAGEIVCFFNEHLEVISKGWLTEMVSHACRPDIAAVGARLLYPNSTVEHAGIILGISDIAGSPHKHFHTKNKGYFNRASLIQNFSAVSGDCLVLKKSLFQEVGGLDEKLPLIFNDINLCLRLSQLGYRNLWTPYALFYHHKPESSYRNISKQHKHFENEAAYLRSLWGNKLVNDPAYNPNLTISSENFQLRFPVTSIRPYNRARNNILKFIVIGHPHSGTTAVSDVFRQVPGLFSGFECGLLMHDKPADFFDTEARHHRVYYQSLKTSWSLTDDDVHYICDTSSWQEVYLRLRERSTRIKDKSVALFDKTPHYTLYLNKILDRIEDSVKIIFLLKDIRAQYWSYKRRGLLGAASNFLGTFSNEFAEELLRLKNAGRIYLLQYEDACLQSELEFKKVFDFLELDFNDDFLSFNSRYKPEYGKGIESKYILAHKQHLTKEDYQQIRALTEHPLFYYDIDESKFTAEDPYRDMARVVIDSPKEVPAKDVFPLIGWIASSSEVEAVWVESNGSRTELNLVERFDPMHAHQKIYSYVKGFRGRLEKSILEGNRLNINYQINSKAFSQIIELDK